MRLALTLAAAGLALGGIFTGPAGTASAQTSAADTIGQLEAQGYTVNIDRVGSAPLDRCVVTSVRNPNTITQTIRVNDRTGPDGRNHSDLVTIVVSRTIQVSLYCAA
jgi:hypothetical protein